MTFHSGMTENGTLKAAFRVKVGIGVLQVPKDWEGHTRTGSGVIWRCVILTPVAMIPRLGFHLGVIEFKGEIKNLKGAYLKYRNFLVNLIHMCFVYSRFLYLPNPVLESKP